MKVGATDDAATKVMCQWRDSALDAARIRPAPCLAIRTRKGTGGAPSRARKA